MSRALPFWAYPAFLLIFLLVTNRWMGWESGIQFLYLSDVAEGYETIARAAPAFPNELIPFHKAQRFLLPWSVGFASGAVGLDYRLVFAGIVILFSGFIFWMAALVVSQWANSALALGILVPCFLSSPYLFRYYWISWGMANDLLYVMGSALLIWGLVRGLGYWVFLGLLLAAVGRQTAIALLPGVLLFLFFSKVWGRKSLFSRFGHSAVTVAIVFGIYFYTGKVASSFSDSNRNLSHALGLVFLGREGTLSLGSFSEHLLRCLLPCLFLILAMAWERVRLWSIETWSLLLMAVGVVAQPFLAGPDISGKNAGRLAALALFPLLAAVAASWQGLRFNESLFGRWQFRFFYSVCFLLSLHHMYSWVGPPSASWFAAQQMGLALIGGALLWQLRRGFGS